MMVEQNMFVASNMCVCVSTDTYTHTDPYTHTHTHTHIWRTYIKWAKGVIYYVETKTKVMSVAQKLNNTLQKTG